MVLVRGAPGESCGVSRRWECAELVCIDMVNSFIGGGYIGVSEVMQDGYWNVVRGLRVWLVKC